MKKFLLLFIILSICSCNLFQENGIIFTIKNESGSPITNVEINTTEMLNKKNYNSIASDTIFKDFLSMKNNKTDGEYILSFNRPNGTNERLTFGYYSNGSSLDESVEILIKKDTVLTIFSHQ